jgi:hypothetical protein
MRERRSTNLGGQEFESLRARHDLDRFFRPPKSLGVTGGVTADKIFMIGKLKGDGRCQKAM